MTDVWAEIDDIDQMREMARNCLQMANDEVLRLRDIIEAMRTLGTIPAEEVAQHFIDLERGSPFSPMYRGHRDTPEHELKSMHARLTEVIRRARVDGSNAQRLIEEREAR